MRETHASFSKHVQVSSLCLYNAYFVHFCMFVRIGWKQRTLDFSMKLSNANPASSWMGERLTLPGAVEFSRIFFLFLLLLFLSMKVKAIILNIICHENGTCMK